MNPNTRQSAEDWMANLGTQFIKIYFYVRNAWDSENHVHDPETLPSTIREMCFRRGVRHAIWGVGEGRWAVLDIRTGDIRTMPSQDAAVMLVTHAR